MSAPDSFGSDPSPIPPPGPGAPLEPHFIDRLEPRPAITAAPEVVGPGRLLAVVLLIAVAFGGGVAVDQAAWRGSNAAPTLVPAPLPTSGAQPPSTSGAGTSPEPASAIPGTAVPGTPGTPAPTTRATPGPTIGPGATVPPFAPANITILWDALKLIEQHFVRRDALNPTDLTYGAIDGLVDSLGDPGHTVFLTPEQVKSENDALNGQITGIGVYLGEQGGAPFIQSVVSGSPAARAGLLSGDRIIAINGTSAENLSIEEVARLVRGPEGTQVTLTVIHARGNSPLNVTITRSKITVPAVTWAMIPGTTIADLRIAEFSSGTTDQFTTGLRGARQAGARGIVLDLRNNPGGFVDDAVGVASQLISGGTVYIRQTADGQRIPVSVKAGGIATDIPLAVLVDYGSASSAEITAGAIQAAKRGPLIGTRTYGTGTVLNTFDLPDGSAVRLGVEEWLTPSGEAIFPNGIQPDQVVELTGDIQPLEPDRLRSMTATQLQSSGDEQLLRAIQVLSAR
jgi:carboxyl-terminal processing protease